ncbi:MAG: TolC family protein [Salinivirgaceae bacterium]|jgi:outer membrane protein|nr:TolC family protein [Salinivirgaceae bacterium]
MMNTKYIKTIVLLGIGFIFCAFQSNAQEKWSLEKCVQHAIENNIQIKQQALNVNYRENQKTQALYNMAPIANGQIGYDFNLGRSLNYDNTYTEQNSQDASFYIGSEVTLFSMFAKQNTLKQRNFELEAALQDLEKARDDISLNVVSAYLDILFNKELVSTAKEQLSVIREQIEYNKKRVEAGNLAKGKLFETQAQEASEELTLTNRENQMILSLINLQQLLELPLSEDFDIVIPNLDGNQMVTSLVLAETVYEKAVQERSEIKSKELTLNSMEKQVDIAKAQLYPSLSMGASYYNNYNNKYTFVDGSDIPFSDQFKNNRRLNLGFTLRVPILNGLTARTNWKNSKIQYESAINDLQLEKNNLRKQIQQAHANAIASMKKYYASEKAVTSAEEAFRYIEEKFKLGIVTPLEYNDSKNKVTNSKSSFIQAKYEYIFRVKILDFYNGKPIIL